MIDADGMICAAQHIKTFYKQCEKEEIADWGESCSDCINIGTCNLAIKCKRIQNPK